MRYYFSNGVIVELWDNPTRLREGGQPFNGSD
jgi:hypothetical protein